LAEKKKCSNDKVLIVYQQMQGVESTGISPSGCA